MEVLRTHWLFADLSDAERTSLAAAAVRHAVADGTVLFRRDDPTPGLHVVETGAIKIFTLTAAGEERIIDIIGAGEFCGEIGVVDAAPSVAWGHALGPSVLWVIPPESFERVLLAHPRICLKLCRVLAGKVRATSRQLDEALFLSSRERVLRHLVRLAEKHGRPYDHGLKLEVRLTHQEIARLAGTARETVSRVLADLQDRSLLRFQGRLMLIPDLTALIREAQETD